MALNTTPCQRPTEKLLLKLEKLAPGQDLLVQLKNSLQGRIMVAEEETGQFAQEGALNPEELEERVVRACLAFAAICSLLAKHTGRVLPDTINVTWTEERPPNLAFGTTISAHPGGTVKAVLREFRGGDIRANTTGKLRVGELTLKKSNGSFFGRQLGHCAEAVSFLIVMCHVRRAFSKQLEVKTFAVASRRIVEKDGATARAPYENMLDSTGITGLHDAIKQAEAHRPMCSNCGTLAEDLFPGGTIQDRSS
ncbi:hypothetical protein C8R47DRAFT_1278407 [Mycena vitilis]|nr:hypothetical protein C8R47DRAFT_1278407 [Mycena vitilis]